jgi:hypothetical protein
MNILHDRGFRTILISFMLHLLLLLSPKTLDTTLSDHNWVNLMHEELENFERNQV